MKQALAGVLATALVMPGLPAYAGMVGTEQMVMQEARAVSRAKVESFIASEQVATQLASWGVAPDAVTERVASLSDAELQQLALEIESQPAGGNALVVVGIVFVVLLILELVGVTNLFRGV